MGHLDAAKSYYRAHLQRRFGQPQGCSFAEIESLELALGHALPAAYREYLLWMGQDHGGVFRGSDWFLADVLDNTAYVSELLAENGIEWRPNGSILAFFCHQGYMIAWFELPATDEDPPCWFFSEGAQHEAPMVVGRFSEFLGKDLGLGSSSTP